MLWTMQLWEGKHGLLYLLSDQVIFMICFNLEITVIGP